LDLSGHRSQLVTTELVARAGCVLVMEASQRGVLRRTIRQAVAVPILVLGDLDPESIDTRAIPDPVDRSDAFFEKTYARIDRCVDEVVRAVKALA
jgi:protein-tyrosine-phosphatase